MIDITTDRDPILPQIPRDTDSLEKVANWRKNHITILKNLHTTVYNDFTSFKNKITEIPVYANNAAALEGSLVAGDLCQLYYRALPGGFKAYVKDFKLLVNIFVTEDLD